jgi:hypothetical protein
MKEQKPWKDSSYLQEPKNIEQWYNPFSVVQKRCNANLIKQIQENIEAIEESNYKTVLEATLSDIINGDTSYALTMLRDTTNNILDKQTENKLYE